MLTAGGSSPTSSSTSRCFLAASRSACDSKLVPMLLRFLRFVTDGSTPSLCDAATGTRAAGPVPLSVLGTTTWFGASSIVNLRLRRGVAFLIPGRGPERITGMPSPMMRTGRLMCCDSEGCCRC